MLLRSLLQIGGGLTVGEIMGQAIWPGHDWGMTLGLILAHWATLLAVWLVLRRRYV